MPYFINDQYATLRTEQTIAEAWAAGCVVNIPTPDELFLDLDTQEQWAELPKRLHRLRVLTGDSVTVYRVTPSTSGLPHRHVYLRIGKPIESAVVRCAMQMFLGSDPVKELLSIDGALAGVPIPCVLIEGNWKGNK